MFASIKGGWFADVRVLRVMRRKADGWGKLIVLGRNGAGEWI